MKVIWQLCKAEWERNFTWRGGCRISCQEIKCFWRKLSCLDIIVTRWNFSARNKIPRFRFLLFLLDNVSQKLTIPLHFAKCTANSYSGGFTQFLKLWLNLCSFRWLSPSLNLVSKQRPNGLWMSYTGFGEWHIILGKKILNIL